MKKIERWTIEFESMEMRAVSEPYTTEDFENDYNNATTRDPQIDEVFMTESDALQAFDKIEPGVPYRTKGPISDLLFYDVWTLSKRTFVLEDDGVVDDETFDIKAWDVAEFESLEIKFSPDEAAKGGHEAAKGGHDEE